MLAHTSYTELFIVMTNSRGKIVVGLTGGIACGKSTALLRFKKLGWSVISADAIVGQILSENDRIKNIITQRWGPELIGDSGNIDKSLMSEIVFAKESEREWVEGILHPIVRSRWISFVQSCSSGKCMVEIPLLFENKLQNNFTCVLSMFSPTTTILDRLHKRGLPAPQAQARITAQLSPEKKASLANYVLWGGGSSQFLHAQVDALSSRLLLPKFHSPSHAS